MDDDAIIAELLAAVQAEAREKFEELIVQLSDDGREAAVAQLSALLPAINPESIRRHAVLALTELGGATVVAQLGQTLATDTDPATRQLALSGLEKVDLPLAIPYLLQVVEDANERLAQRARYALGTAASELAPQLDSEDALLHDRAQKGLTPISVALLGQLLLSDNRTTVQTAAAQLLGGRGEAAVEPLCRALHELEEPDLLWGIISALRQIGRPEVVPCIGERLVKEGNRDLRRQAATALAQLDQPAAVPFLVTALVREDDTNVRDTVVNALARQADWHRKTDEFLTLLEQGSLERANLNSTEIVTALRPPGEQAAANRHLYTDYLLEQALAYTDNPRMTAILAALIIASAEGSMSLAGERLNVFQQERDLPEERLQTLRIEIGGATALSPILTELKHNLAENFQKPIAQLNAHTQRMWRITIVFAQIGFLARTLMSIALFIVGVYLVLDSYWQVMAGNLAAEQLVGTSVSFLSGIITMLLMVYRGPLREIRQSVNDLGIASAAFIAYVHRVLQISHTFSFAYLREKISFDEMEKSSRLIDEAMASTISLLRETNEVEKEDGRDA